MESVYREKLIANKMMKHTNNNEEHTATFKAIPEHKWLDWQYVSEINVTDIMTMLKQITAIQKPTTSLPVKQRT